MRIVMQRSDLTRVLSHITKVVEPRNTMPILANVLLTAETERMTARATDLDIEITATAAAACEPGSITVNAKELLQIARKLAGDEITLELDGVVLVVKAGRSRFKLPTIAPASFPSIGDGEFGEPFEIDLGSIFASMSFAISNDEARYYLNGIYLHNVGDNLVAVATDGHRLVKQTVGKAGAVPGIIVPRKTVGLVPQGTVSVSLDDRRIRIAAGDTIIVSKLIEGTFPDYERVIPKSNDSTMTADRSIMLAAVERVATIASDRSGTAVKIEMIDGAIRLTTRGGDSEATEDVPATHDGPLTTIGFNVNYLAEQMRHISGETAHFMLQEGGPATVRGDNDAWLSVLMPMRVA